MQCSFEKLRPIFKIWMLSALQSLSDCGYNRAIGLYHFFISLLAKKKRSSHCNKELLNYDCMLSILFNCKIFKQEILTQAAVPMSCRYKIRHELEVNKLKL